MRILIGSRTQDRVFHWEEFSRYLSTFGVECKVVNNMDIVDGFPTKKIRKWVPSSKQFDILIRDFTQTNTGMKNKIIKYRNEQESNIHHCVVLEQDRSNNRGIA